MFAQTLTSGTRAPASSTGKTVPVARNGPPRSGELARALLGRDGRPDRQALDFALSTLSSCAAVALWPFVAIFASALALVTALVVVVLVMWSLHDAPNYWRE